MSTRAYAIEYTQAREATFDVLHEQWLIDHITGQDRNQDWLMVTTEDIAEASEAMAKDKSLDEIEKARRTKIMIDILMDMKGTNEVIYALY